MTGSFTELGIYHECPRKLGFIKLGYKPVAVSEAMTAGQFVHEGLRAFFAGGAFDSEYATQAVNEAKDTAITAIDQHPQDRDQHQKLVKQTNDAAQRAHQLLNRYFNGYAGDYVDPVPEMELRHANVVCHIDLVARFKRFKDHLSVIDFKTSKSPDMRWYDFSGQVDVYSYIMEEKYSDRVGLVIYDIISEEGLFRHIRKPHLERGRQIFGQISTLDNYPIDHLLNHPQPQWTCPRCDYFHPCWLWEQDEKKGSLEYLMSNYIYIANKEGKEDAEG